MCDEVGLLHHAEHVDWESCWHAPLATPLWRYNLHYMEYLLPLAHARKLTGEARYAEKAKRLVDAWIDANPRGLGGVGWDPYPIAMRAVNWLALRAELRGELEADEAFLKKMDSSLAEQAEHLSQHAERDLLANHYLEDLKACALLAAYFDDEAMMSAALPLLEEQVAEQVLPDGMHFERSPMYHKIVLEDLLRVAAALGESPSGVPAWLSDAIRRMCGCLHSLERGVSRTPLFNDAGDNVAKGRDALLECARRMLGVEPHYCDAFPRCRVLPDGRRMRRSLREGDLRCRHPGTCLCIGACALRCVVYGSVCRRGAVDRERRHVRLPGCAARSFSRYGSA